MNTLQTDNCNVNISLLFDMMQELTKSQKQILIYLIRKCNFKNKYNRNFIYVTQRTIADTTGIAIMTVSTTFRKFYEMNLIIMISHDGVYMFNPDIMWYDDTTMTKQEGIDRYVRAKCEYEDRKNADEYVS